VAGNIVFPISGPVARADIPCLCERLRVMLQRSDSEHLICDVGGLLDPDAVTVEALAYLQLTARRLGHEIRLRHACSELQGLIALMGLTHVFPLSEA
jgi:ABC-type transporter Mla MlaB component